MALRKLFLAFLFTNLVKRGCCEYVSLTLTTQKTLQPLAANESYCGIYNPSYVSIPTRKQPDESQFHQAVYLNSTDPLGCSDLSPDFPVSRSLIVDRGNCTFYHKALLAQRVNASILVIVYNETMVPMEPSLEPVDTDGPSITIPVILISNVTGEELKDWLKSPVLVYLSVYIPTTFPVDPGSVILFCIAVATVLMAAFMANIPFQFLRYGLLVRGDRESSSGAEDSPNRLSVVSLLVGLVFMVAATCTLLLLLYFFYSPMVYIVLALYCTVGLYSLLSPFIALIPLGDRCRIPPNKIPVLKYQPNILFFLTVLFSVTVVLWWVLERHSGYAWILQDILGFAFITMLLSRLRFLKVWFVAVLMILLFVYDIFMVFITPYFTHDGVSVMEKAATGPGGSGTQELLPVVFLVPKLLYPSTLEALCSDYLKSRPVSLLGYGDVGIPGLLVTLCLKFDLNFRRGRCFKPYYATCGIAYFVGLAVTYLALTLMQTAQPALFYLVPTTLGSVTLLSLWRKEFTLFFTNKTKSASDEVEENSVADGLTSERKPARDISDGVAESDTETEIQFVQDEKRALITNSDDQTASH